MTAVRYTSIKCKPPYQNGHAPSHAFGWAQKAIYAGSMVISLEAGYRGDAEDFQPERQLIRRLLNFHPSHLFPWNVFEAVICLQVVQTPVYVLVRNALRDGKAPGRTNIPTKKSKDGVAKHARKLSTYLAKSIPENARDGVYVRSISAPLQLETRVWGNITWN